MVARLLAGLLVLVAVAFPARALAQDDSQLIIYWENDIIADTDRSYTNGVKITWLSPELNQIADYKSLRWAEPAYSLLPGFVGGEVSYNVGVSVGQQMYTPEDLEDEALIEQDRPYAGFLHGALALHAKTTDVLNTFELTVGMVGPTSQAEETQKFIHRLIDSTIPQGWDNQLENELGLMLAYRRTWRHHYPIGGKYGFDILPNVGLVAGNVETAAGAGVQLRLGYRLPSDFGSSLIRPGAGVAIPGATDGGFRAYLLAGAQGRAKVRDIFLDGNTFTDSHSVAKNWLVGDLAAGMGMHYGPASLTYTLAFRSSEYEGQDGGHVFGSLTLGVVF
jgi:hypothetical protein